MERVLIDGDILVYRVARRNEHAHAKNADEWEYRADAAEARAQMARAILSIKTAVRAGDVRVYLSDTKANFRRDRVYGGYKSDRAGWSVMAKHSLFAEPAPPRPMLFKSMRDYLREEYGAVTLPSLEADDLLGLALTKGGGVAASVDKDLLSVPGSHFNWDRPDAGIVEVTPEEAYRSFMAQAVMGDSTDGYPGCPTIGKVKAAALIKKHHDDLPAIWPAILECYEKQGQTEDEALAQARCARILRQGDYDAKTKEIRLWTHGVDW